MNQAQHDWVEKCIIGNEPQNRVVVHEKPAGLLVEVRERRSSRERCAAVILLGEDGKPERVDS